MKGVFMIEFKTVVLPMSEVRVNKEEELYTVKTANIAVAPIAKVLENEARGGWHLHSCTVIPARIYRNKGCLEVILGWIPIIGEIFKSKATEVTPEYYTLIFQREVE